MSQLIKKPVAIAVAASVAGMMAVGTAQAVKYEVWASDQSNSVAGSGLGKDGSLLWVWDSEGPTGVKAYLASSADGSGTQPAVLNCNGSAGAGPCNIKDVFTDGLVEVGVGGVTTGETLGSVGPIARLHGAIPDPQNRYVNINMFAGETSTGSGLGNGFVGIMDGEKKSAVAMFRVTRTNAASGGGRSLHMSFWNSTGSALLLANLHGRILERIDIERTNAADPDEITAAKFNLSASVGMGGQSAIVESATAFTGMNAHSTPVALVSSVVGAYTSEATALTFGTGSGSNGGGPLECRQNDATCTGPNPTAVPGGRGGNVIVCPIVSSNNLVYVTFGGGGLLVADAADTPMNLVGAYDNSVVNGAGCGGVEVGGFVYLNAGTSASGAGATQSTESMFKLSTKGFGASFSTNVPGLEAKYTKFGSTATGGRTVGPASNATGQLPASTPSGTISTREDSHGMTATVTGNYVHMGDRIQNYVTSFDSVNFGRVQYPITGTGAGPASSDAGCAIQSVTDGGVDFPIDDPSPDLMATGPNNKFLFAALRGPNPVTVSHNAQGSCPGVGVITLNNGAGGDNGASGTMLHVLRTTNPVGLISGSTSAPSGGKLYGGAEFSDVHGVALRIR